jgi:hypothetical protein
LNADPQSDSFTSLESAPHNSNHIPDGTYRVIMAALIIGLIAAVMILSDERWGRQ